MSGLRDKAVYVDGQLEADLFAPKPGTLTLMRPITVLVAVLRTARSARCEGIAVMADRPVTALCGALVAMGHPDMPMQVRDPGGRALVFIDSIRDVALGTWSPG